MAGRDEGRKNLDQMVRQLIIDIFEDHKPRAGHVKKLAEEVRELRRTVSALERRLDTLSGRKASRAGGPGRGRPGRPPIHTNCTVRGCAREHYAKGLCSMHYQQWRRTGDWPGPAETDPAKAGSKGRKRGSSRRTTKSKTRR